MPSPETAPDFNLVLGLDAFGEVSRDASGELVSHATVLRNALEEGVLADQVGIDYFGIGEHHREDMPASAPDLILAAIAARTEQIRLGSAVTVLSSDDPVRVFQRYSTLNALSNGRAEVILGRGSSIESFPLFGYDLGDYDLLFAEKLDLFTKLVAAPHVTWQGATRPPLRDQLVVPRLENGTLDTWVGVGGSPDSVRRAARHGLPLMIAIISGSPLRFLPFAELHRHELQRLKHPPQPVGIHSLGYVAESDEEAYNEFWPHYHEMMTRIGRERGFRSPTPASYAAEVAQGSLYVGSPDTVARRITETLRGLGATRFDLKYGMGDLAHEQLLRCIELYGERVIPLVREMMADDAPELTSARKAG